MTTPGFPSPRITGLLESIDYFRRSPSRIGGKGGHKEWQHFLIHTERVHLLVNFNLVDDRWAKDPRRAETARVIVLARTEAGWDGDADRFDEREVHVVPGRIDARFGRNVMQFEDGRYHLSIALRDRPIAAELEIVPTTVPALSNNQPLSRDRSLSWMFVPRLVARGTVRVGGRVERVEGAPAYHDHNWGHFRWGDDFSWEWGSALPWDASNPWSMVYMRMSDRGRSLSRCQGLYLWKNEEHRAIFRDEQIRVSLEGCFEQSRALKIPRVMALLSPATVSDLPRRLSLVARGGADEVQMSFEPEDVAQVIMPNECDVEAVTALNEVSGRVVLRGEIGGEAVEMEGPGVFEFIRD